MKHWSTIIFAVDPITGKLTKYEGPIIEAPTALLAHEYCQHNELGYCNIGDEVISVIPCDENFKPDFSKEVDYKKHELN